MSACTYHPSTLISPSMIQRYENEPFINFIEKTANKFDWNNEWIKIYDNMVNVYGRDHIFPRDIHEKWSIVSKKLFALEKKDNVENIYKNQWSYHSDEKDDDVLRQIELGIAYQTNKTYVFKALLEYCRDRKIEDIYKIFNDELKFKLDA